MSPMSVINHAMPDSVYLLIAHAHELPCCLFADIVVQTSDAEDFLPRLTGVVLTMLLLKGRLLLCLIPIIVVRV